MITGLTIEKIKKEIQVILFGKSEIHSIYGFGSFFRSEPFEDVDILVVLSATHDSLLDIYYSTGERFRDLEIKWSVPIHLTYLTVGEILEKPLRDMDSLIKLYPQ
jgi:predicted nucleotidyltransferase